MYTVSVGKGNRLRFLNRFTRMDVVMKKNMTEVDCSILNKLLSFYEEKTVLRESDAAGWWYHMNYTHYNGTCTVYKNHMEHEAIKWDFETLGQAIAFCDAVISDRLHIKAVEEEKVSEEE